MRILNCKILKDKKWRGYTASMRNYFYGVKVQLVTTKSGITKAFHFTLGKTAEEKQPKLKPKRLILLYIDVDRLQKLNLNVYVEPKLNNENIKLDYITILLEALKAPENFEHLKGLVETKLREDWIEIKSDLKPILTPFLIAQFLAVVQDLVRKGLKKSYYTVQENLNSKVKGKILVGEQIKHNLLKNKLTKTICQYQEFGFNTEANQFLKHVLSVIPNLLSDFNQDNHFNQLQEVLNYCKGGFYQVNKKCLRN